LASTSARDGSDNSLLSTVGAAVIPSANQNTTPKNAMAYTITPTGLPVLQHKAPKDGPLDTPRPPNFDAFVEKYDEFDRESLDPKEGGVNPKRNTKKLSIASEAGGVGVVGEALVGVSQAAPSVSSSLAQRGKIPSDISRRTLKSAGRMNSIARMHRLKDYDVDPENTDPENRIVTIDCGGKVLRTFLRTLLKHPGTMLHSLAQPGGELYEDGAVFIDRDYRCFAAILNYYRTGILEQPSKATDEQWNMELLFFKIENPLFKFPTAAEIELAQLVRGKPKGPSIRSSIWLLWEDPSSSVGAKCIMGLSVILSIVGVIAFVLETEQSFREDSNESYRLLGFTSSDVRWGLKTFEISVVAFFTVEFCIRFYANDKKKEFMRRPMTWCDLVAVCPFYIGLMLDPAVIKGSSSLFVRILTLARVLRVVGLVFKLGKYSHGVRVLATTFKTCVMELSILGVLLFIAVVMISSGIYFCEYVEFPEEGQAPTEFTSISRSMYFSMISVTTIGYGDMTPKTACGEFVACVAGLSGIFVLGLPISIIGVKFQERYDDMLKEVKIHSERERLNKIDAKLQSMKGMKVLANSILGPRPLGAGDLTAQELDTVERRCLAVFKEVDLDESGEIDVDELGIAMKELGMEIPKDVLEVMMQAMDEDGSQTIDQGEFLEFVLKCIVGDVKTLSEYAETRVESTQSEGYIVSRLGSRSSAGKSMDSARSGGPESPKEGRMPASMSPLFTGRQ